MKFLKLMHSKRNMLILFLVVSVIVGVYYMKEGFRRKFGGKMNKMIKKDIHRQHANKPFVPKPKIPVFVPPNPVIKPPKPEIVSPEMKQLKEHEMKMQLLKMKKDKMKQAIDSMSGEEIDILEDLLK